MLKLKDRYVSEFLNILVSEFGDEIIFTGGTSLLKRGIINRFSEDIDLICTCSRKKISNFINNIDDWQVNEQRNGSFVNNYVISKDDVDIKLDLVNFRQRDKGNLLDLSSMDLVSINSLDGEVIGTNPIQCRSVQEIFADKICALFELEIHSIGNNKFLTYQYDFNIRLFRHFYDIAMINLDISEESICNQLTNELAYRKLNTLSNFTNDDYLKVLNYINSESFFKHCVQFSEQCFEEIDARALSINLINILDNQRMIQILTNVFM